jgi:hypothetical protein
VSPNTFKAVHRPEWLPFQDKKRKRNGEESNRPCKRIKVQSTEETVDDGAGTENDRKRKITSEETGMPGENAKPIVEGEWPSTAKIDELFRILEFIRDNDRTEKVIVFSQVYVLQRITYPVYRVL